MSAQHSLIMKFFRKIFRKFLDKCFKTYIKNLKADIRREVILAKNESDIWVNKNIGIKSYNSFDKKIVVSLTTIPSRVNEAALAINTLLKQTFKPHKVILWLGKERFDLEDLPNCYKNLTNRGLEIRPRTDIGPHTKLLYALEEYPDSVIITADDDVLYSPIWLDLLLEEYRKDDSKIYCHRGHYITINDENRIEKYSEWDFNTDIKEPSLRIFPTGVGGVLYPPNIFDKMVFEENIFSKVCPNADDIWFKAASLLNNIECKILDKNCVFSEDLFLIEHSQHYGLYKENLDKKKNDQQLLDTFRELDLLYRLS